MKSVKSRITHLFVAAMALMISWSSAANTDSDATAIIESTTSQIMAIVDDAPDYFDTDPSRFYDSIGAVLDETIDWRGFAKGVMGEYAVAKYLGLPFDTSINLDGDGGETDLMLGSYNIQVKSTKYKTGRLVFNNLKEIIADLSSTQTGGDSSTDFTAMLSSQVEQIIDNRLAELTPEQVKDIIQEMIHKHLGWLVVWGGVFGGIIGFGTRGYLMKRIEGGGNEIFISFLNII